MPLKNSLSNCCEEPKVEPGEYQPYLLFPMNATAPPSGLLPAAYFPFEKWGLIAFRCCNSLIFRLVGVEQGNIPKIGGDNFRGFETGLCNDFRQNAPDIFADLRLHKEPPGHVGHQ